MPATAKTLNEIIEEWKDIFLSLDDTLSFDYGWKDINGDYKLGVIKNGVRDVFPISRELATDLDRDRERIERAKYFLRWSFYLRKA